MTPLKEEIAWKKEFIKRLQTPIKSLEKAVDKEKAKAEARLAKARTFESFEEAQDAYGYGEITLEELEDFVAIAKNATTTFKTSKSLALAELHRMIRQAEKDIKDLEFMMLPDQEKDKRAKALQEWKEEHNERMQEFRGY
jgi:cob(I)alamin adenosyltransferase